MRLRGFRCEFGWLIIAGRRLREREFQREFERAAFETDRRGEGLDGRFHAFFVFDFQRRSEMSGAARRVGDKITGAFGAEEHQARADQRQGRGRFDFEVVVEVALVGSAPFFAPFNIAFDQRVREPLRFDQAFFGRFFGCFFFGFATWERFKRERVFGEHFGQNRFRERFRECQRYAVERGQVRPVGHFFTFGPFGDQVVHGSAQGHVAGAPHFRTSAVDRSLAFPDFAFSAFAARRGEEAGAGDRFGSEFGDFAPRGGERVRRESWRDVGADVLDDGGRDHRAFGVARRFAFDFRERQDLEVGHAKRNASSCFGEAFFFGFFDRDFFLRLEERP